jgi:predicted nuclease of predicted toxin-antitoxin system
VLFLADESCDFAVVRALRTAGHDVVAVAEISRGAEDSSVVDLAVRQRRILLTEDKDSVSWCLRACRRLQV